MRRAPKICTDGRSLTLRRRRLLDVRIIEAVTISQDLDPFLSLKGLAGYASLSRRLLQDLVNDTSDPIPSYRIGAKILVKKSEFDRWMARRRNRKPLDAGRLAAADAQALLTARPRKGH